MFDYFVMSYKVSDYTFMIVLMCWPKPIIYSDETHLVTGVMDAFVFLLAAIVRALASTFVGSTALKRPMRILTTLPWMPLCIEP